MKKWTLESPGAGLLLHLVFFALVVAAVQYSEHRSAPSTAVATVAAPPPRASAMPARAQHAATSNPHQHPLPHELPMAGAMAPLRSTP